MELANWAKIFTTEDLYRAQIAKDILEAKDIQSVIVDKKDSSYGIFGEIELYVQKENVIKAIHLLEKKELDV